MGQVRAKAGSLGVCQHTCTHPRDSFLLLLNTLCLLCACRSIAEMFGGERASQIKQLDSMIPKTVKDFEEAAELVAKL